MAEHSKLHLWLNTLIACIAIGVSAFSAFVSWKSYSVNVEAFGFGSNFTYDCPLLVGFMSTRDKKSVPSIGLCWQVVVANQSSSRASITFAKSSTMLSDARSSEPAPVELLDRKGTTKLSMPASFEDGEARTIIVRVGVPITDAFGKIINDTIKSQAAQFRTLADAAAVAAQAKLDVLGNPASVSELGGFGYIMTPSPRYQKTVVVLRLHSGRDKVFETELTYPNDINIVFRTSDTHQPQDR